MAALLGPRGNAGRPKEPIEKRAARSKNPHRNRKSPKDTPIIDVVACIEIPEEPPYPLNELEMQAWDLITRDHRGPRSKWIYRSDCAYLLATCRVYGQWEETRLRLEAFKAAGGDIYDEETNKCNPLVMQQARLGAEFQKSLVALGCVPTRRQITMEDPMKENPDSLIAH